MKLNVEDVNCDKMIDRPVYSDWVCVTGATERMLNTQLYDVIACPKACLHFYYILKSVYFFFTRRVYFKVVV